MYKKNFASSPIGAKTSASPKKKASSSYKPKSKTPQKKALKPLPSAASSSSSSPSPKSLYPVVSRGGSRGNVRGATTTLVILAESLKGMAIGDALGYHAGKWEFNYDAADIWKQYVQSYAANVNRIPFSDYREWPVSDDTVMSIATMRAMRHLLFSNQFFDVVDNKANIPDLIRNAPEASRAAFVSAVNVYLNANNGLSGKGLTIAESQNLYDYFAFYYNESMAFMEGRGAGNQSIAASERYKKAAKGAREPFVASAGGNGAAMRVGPIGVIMGLIETRGLRHAIVGAETPSVDINLIGMVVESAMATHNNPVGVLGAVAAGYFSKLAVTGTAIINWWEHLFNVAIPLARYWIAATVVARGEYVLFKQYAQGWNNALRIWLGYCCDIGLLPNNSRSVLIGNDVQWNAFIGRLAQQEKFPDTTQYLAVPQWQQIVNHVQSLSNTQLAAGANSSALKKVIDKAVTTAAGTIVGSAAAPPAVNFQPPPIFPADIIIKQDITSAADLKVCADVAVARDNFFRERYAYKMQWAGSSGIDAVIMAYDSFMNCGGNFNVLMRYAAITGGDSDSVASIAGGWLGSRRPQELFRLSIETEKVELYRSKLVPLAIQFSDIIDNKYV